MPGTWALMASKLPKKQSEGVTIYAPMTTVTSLVVPAPVPNINHVMLSRSHTPCLMRLFRVHVSHGALLREMASTAASREKSCSLAHQGTTGPKTRVGKVRRWSPTCEMLVRLRSETVHRAPSYCESSNRTAFQRLWKCTRSSVVDADLAHRKTRARHGDKHHSLM